MSGAEEMLAVTRSTLNGFASQQPLDQNLARPTRIARQAETFATAAARVRCSSPELVQEFAHDGIELAALVEAVETNAETAPPAPNVNAASVQIIYDPLLKIAVDADACTVPIGIAWRRWMDADAR